MPGMETTTPRPTLNDLVTVHRAGLTTGVNTTPTIAGEQGRLGIIRSDGMGHVALRPERNTRRRVDRRAWVPMADLTVAEATR